MEEDLLGIRDIRLKREPKNDLSCEMDKFIFLGTLTRRVTTTRIMVTPLLITSFISFSKHICQWYYGKTGRSCQYQEKISLDFLDQSSKMIREINENVTCWIKVDGQNAKVLSDMIVRFYCS